MEIIDFSSDKFCKHPEKSASEVFMIELQKKVYTSNSIKLLLKNKLQFTELEKVFGEIILNKYEDKIKELDISFNKLEELPEKIWNFSSIEELKLGNNNLKNISSKIQNFQNLKVLNLRNNNIQYLPEEIGYLPNLEILNISGNHPLGRENISKSITSNNKISIIF